jgi:hypothetical protein
MEDEEKDPAVTGPHPVPWGGLWRVHDPADIIAFVIETIGESFQIIKDTGGELAGNLCDLSLHMAGDQDLVRQSDPQFGSDGFERPYPPGLNIVETRFHVLDLIIGEWLIVTGHGREAPDDLFVTLLRVMFEVIKEILGLVGDPDRCRG